MININLQTLLIIVLALITGTKFIISENFDDKLTENTFLANSPSSYWYAGVPPAI